MYSFQDIIGHTENINTLIKAIVNNRVAHAYLFVGTPGVGKGTIAHGFAKALLCENPVAGEACNRCRHCGQVEGNNHPDLHVTTPTGATIKLEQIHYVQKNVNYRSYQGGRQVYIIEDCDVMTAEAANSLLKTLEEPPVNTVFILISSRPYALLPTILSRCQQFWFKPMSVDQIVEGLNRQTNLTAVEQQMIAAMAGGSLGRAISLVKENIHTVRNSVLNTLDKIKAGDMVPLLQQAATLASERTDAVEWVEMLQLWIRDVLVWSQTEDKTLIINVDLLDEVAQWSGRYRPEQLLAMMAEVEQARWRLESKGNTRLVIDALLLNLAHN
ncbi:DNA polymerase III subunit delta' [Peptococcaceae bacterium 1198_IL3148]